ncbi:putative HTH-type transcriptional regulator [Gottschalkia purinilytica]|uniref:Putative HTH-type transcriptional regulator n=1 Tax=Gottschalkia purinilytica TaxID=1503 RepID=A0A0L0WFK3_GOTPU|nr:helix-turn-helix transcriptional regulator [Gottschalkia purinilytica]KNF10200.1 putative HTH-type transcriptional regulator [Gottschalkia purinilytica]
MNRVKLYRKKYNLTQLDLSEIIGVTKDYISQIERGRIPGMETANKLAKLFDTTIDELFFEDIKNSKFYNDK